MLQQMGEASIFSSEYTFQEYSFTSKLSGTQRPHTWWHNAAPPLPPRSTKKNPILNLVTPKLTPIFSNNSILNTYKKLPGLDYADVLS